MQNLRQTTRLPPQIRSMPYLLQRVGACGSDSRRKEIKLVRRAVAKEVTQYANY